ncbi:acyltransferase family protein [Blastococcus sp. TF02A_35]|uniref:acyltransferase family protein n=1 Tax=Blastococcus sp. TF02A-35 TaxID=2559612 RepID=UPI00107473E1|nr:acyltransferase family protein [Blastococcus sp. TF02A_35]TFV50364.1 acyltransferase [Blastococcus sp. TF02A_35]
MTAPGRERGVDVLRGAAMLGVVLGHWLVTAPLAPDEVTGAVGLDSPLRTMPELAPVSWLLQTLGLFCLVAGFAAARSWGASTRPAGRWWWARVRRLAGPAGAVAAAVALVVVVMALAGAPQSLVVRTVRIVVTPSWFLAVHLLLSAATPVLVRLDARFGGSAVVAGVATAGVLAAVAPGTALAPVAVLAVWCVPWQLGIAMARRPLRPQVAAALLAGGVLAVVVLVLSGAVPPTAVGVPGADRSNLDPPSVATLALVLGQGGAAALLLPGLARDGRAARALAALGRRAYPVFLLHQAVFAAVWLATLRVGPLPGLHEGTATPGWLAARTGWVVVLAVVLGGAVHRSRAPVPGAAAAVTSTSPPGRPRWRARWSAVDAGSRPR